MDNRAAPGPVVFSLPLLLNILVRRWWLVAACTALGLIAEKSMHHLSPCCINPICGASLHIPIPVQSILRRISPHKPPEPRVVHAHPEQIHERIGAVVVP